MCNLRTFSQVEGSAGGDAEGGGGSCSVSVCVWICMCMACVCVCVCVYRGEGVFIYQGGGEDQSLSTPLRMHH